jgi:putative alpha-1,2-mannosidase
LNGKPIVRAWLRHREIASGERLVLTMSKTPAHWAVSNLPPSHPSPARSSEESSSVGGRRGRPEEGDGRHAALINQ